MQPHRKRGSPPPPSGALGGFQTAESKRIGLVMTSGAAARNNVQVFGAQDGPVLVFAHGFGTDQSMWGRILPWFTDRYRVVLLDHVGSGGSDQSAYDSATYSTLDAYVDDLVEVCGELDLQGVTLIGHSVGSMMAISAA